VSETCARSSSISVCVINHEGEDRLEDTLGALQDHGTGIGEIIVVDSASTDRGVSIVRQRFRGVRVIALPVNLGPAVARNRGFEAATYDRVLFVDNDIIVQPGCLERLARALDDDVEAVVALPRVRLRRSPDVLQFEGADAHYLGLMALRGAGEPADTLPSAPYPVSSMGSGCFLMDRGRWGREPPFDETFGFNFEDHDFGIRVRVTGGRILVVPAASCLHGEGTRGYSVRGDQPYPPIRVYQLIRGRWVIVLKTYQLRTLLLLSPVLGLYELVQLALAARRGWMKEWRQALYWIVAHRGEIYRRRKSVQAARIVSDRDLIEGGRSPFRKELPRSSFERVVLSAFEGLCDAYWRVIRHAM